MTQPEIIVVDDEAQIRKLLEITFRSNGYRMVHAATSKEGLSAAAARMPDLIILDLGLPDESGHETLEKLREWYARPIIILSVQSGEKDIVRALDNGANDYLVKPFRTGELLARIRTVLRGAVAEENRPVVRCGDLEINLSEKTVKRGSELLKLTVTQYSLLALFGKNEGKVLTHHYILREVWGQDYTDQLQYLRVFVAQLRKKIEPDPNRPSYIVTEAGIGYRFVAPDTW